MPKIVRNTRWKIVLFRRKNEEENLAFISFQILDNINTSINN